MTKTRDIVRKKFVESPPGAARLLIERVAQRSQDIIEELLESNRRNVQIADMPPGSGDISGDRISKKHRPLEDKSLAELLAISVRLQENAAALTEETRVLVAAVQKTRAVI
jgi:hypothetical protein